MAISSALAQAQTQAPAPDRAANVEISPPTPPIPGRIVPVGQIRYRLHEAGVTATLGYTEAVARLLFTVDAPHPSLEAQARLLEPLLVRLLRDHPDLAELDVSLRERDPIIAGLQQLLVDSPNWDRTRGRVRHGRLDLFLAALIDRHALAGPIGAVFVAQGYQLAAKVRLVYVASVSGYRSARLPTEISGLSFHATRMKRG